MKKFKVIVLIICIAALTAGCTLGGGPKGSVNTLFKAIQTLDSEKMQAVLYYENDKDTSDKNPFEDESFKEIYLENSKILKYKINKTTVDGDKATVNINCTYGDATEAFNSALKSYIGKSLGAALSFNQSEKKDSETLLKEELSSSIKENKLKSITEDMDIQLKKVDGKWLVVSDDNIANIMTANLYKSIMANLYKSFNDLSKSIKN